MTTHIDVRLTQGQFARIDASDFPIVSKHKWYAMRWKHGFYARTNIGGKVVFMHRLILGLGSGRDIVVDHINHDGLNNTRINLRACTPQMNTLNRRSRIGSSDIAGAWKNGDRWSSRITIGGKKVYLGSFPTREEAGIAYSAAKRVIDLCAGVAT